MTLSRQRTSCGCRDSARLVTPTGVLLLAAALLFAAPQAAALAAPPANDDFANAEAPSSLSVTGTNVDATKEGGEPNHAGDAGGHSVWYRATAPASGTATLDTCDSDFDTLLAVYTGGSVSALTEVASNDDACGAKSRVSFGVTAGNTYYAAVDGFGGATGNITLDLGGFGGPPPPPGPTPAAPPTLLSVGQVQGKPTARWSLPPGQESSEIEVSRSRANDSKDQFDDFVLFDDFSLRPATTSW